MSEDEITQQAKDRAFKEIWIRLAGVATDTRRVVILGKTGAGKSSLANTIFGEKPFKVDHTANSGTIACQAETRSVNGRNITLVDTPGFFDTDRPEEELKREIVRCITECAPGPHAFLIVLKVEKFTEHEKAVINKIHQYFSEEVFKYATVVFTYGDQLKGQTIEEFVRQNKSLSDLVKKCGGRCHVIDNEYWKNSQQDEYRSNKFQVKELLKTIDELTEANKGGCYTNEMLQVVQEIIEQKKMHIRKSSGNMSEEEITRQAKDRTFKEIWIRLAGVATGVLLGALFGVVEMVLAVVNALKELVPAAKTVIEGGAAGAGGLGATGTTFISAAAVGAAVGGYKGYHAAEGADTPWEAAKMTAAALMEGAQSMKSTIDGPSNSDRLSLYSNFTFDDIMDTRRVVILGKTGAGKSSLANTIFGEKPFKVDDTANSGTTVCQAETRSVNGRNITLVDTPGFFDTDRPEEELKREIVRCITECAPGPHAFLIVLKVEKFTEQEQDVINKIHQYFSEEVFKYATVVFTYGDQLKGQTIEKFVCQNKSLSDLVKKCGGRCHVIDNNYWKNSQQDEYRANKYQVKELLKTIDELTEANKGRCYTNQMLQVVQEIIEQKKMHIRKSSGNMSEEEITRQAKDRAFKEIWIRLAGVGTVSDWRLVILGKTGAGKSSLANTIFGEKLFTINNTANSGTRECQAETRSVNGRNITLIDTPAFFDTDKSEEELKPEIVRCITECAPGPHAFLIVLQVGRFTEHEQAVINKIHQYFSEEVFKYASVIFTHGDQLKGQTIEEFVRQNKSLSDLVKKQPKDEYRSNQFQVKELLKSVDKTTEANEGGCYTNEMLQTVEDKIQQEEKRIRKSAGNMSDEEIRKQAKSRAFKGLWIKLAGFVTGALLGAFLGLNKGQKIAKMAAALGSAAGGKAETVLATLAVASAAVVEAVKGGLQGYEAAEGAGTPWEAAKRAAEAVMKDEVLGESQSQPALKQNQNLK
ncbi:hypothetical protein ABVT39_001455 [Epinephelus coioides]